MADRVAAIANQLNPRSGPGPLLQGEVAIITGSGQGIGKAAALLFAAHGASVVVSDLDASRTHATTEEITKAGGKAIGVPGDVMAADYGEKIVAATIKAFGKINHIINNAGFTADKMTHTMDDDTFRLMLECHAVAPFRIIRAAAPHMRIKDQSKRENRSIVNVSSTSGLHGNTGQANYSVAKAGVTGLSKTLCKEWGPFGVRVNTVAYGWIDTRLTRAKEAGETITVNGKAIALGIPGRPAGPGGAGPTSTPDIPLGRPGTADEAASAMLFLASPLASYISGHTLEVAGGRGI